MLTISKWTAPSPARSRCFSAVRASTSGAVALRAMLVLLAVTVVRAVPAHAQPAVAGVPVADSIVLHRSAVAATNAYEVAAFHYWPSAAHPCVVGNDNRDCAGGWCEPMG